MTENTENSDKTPYIDLRMCQTLLDNYRATLQKKRQEDQDAEESTEQDLSSDVHDVSSAAGDEVAEHNDESPATNPTEAAAAAAAAVPAESQKQAYVDWETMQEMSKAATMNGDDSAVDQPSPAAVVSNEEPAASTAGNKQPLYASVGKFDRRLQLATTDNSGGCDAETEVGGVTYTAVTRVKEQSTDDRADDSTRHTKLIRVTSEGVAVPIRFVVRLVGSVPMSSDDRDACSSSELVMRHVRRLCGRQHADAESDVAPPPYDVVYYWPTDVDITLELSGKYLRLVDSSKDSELFSQRLHSLRQWSIGPGRNSRHFAFVSPEPAGERFACHVFRCCGDHCAKDVASALRRVCSEMQQLKEQITTSL